MKRSSCHEHRESTRSSAYRISGDARKDAILHDDKRMTQTALSQEWYAEAKGTCVEGHEYSELVCGPSHQYESEQLLKIHLLLVWGYTMPEASECRIGSRLRVDERVSHDSSPDRTALPSVPTC